MRASLSHTPTHSLHHFLFTVEAQVLLSFYAPGTRGCTSAFGVWLFFCLLLSAEEAQIKANIGEECLSFSLRHTVHHIHRRGTSVTPLLCSRKRGRIRLRLYVCLLPFAFCHSLICLYFLYICFTCTFYKHLCHMLQ